MSPRDLHQIQQCEKLILFRDEVLSGRHPRIKPAHLVAGPSTPSAPNTTTPTTAPTPTPIQIQPAEDVVNGDPPVASSLPLSDTGQPRPQVVLPPPGQPGNSSSVGTNGGGPGGGPVSPPSSRPFGQGNTAINPIFLQKSDGLVKAELQLRRTKIERSLREQVEQRRASAKASLQAPEPLADFDLADVLSRALVLVQATAAAQSTDDTAANASASTDSFDDNTFYSSRHDSPESTQLARIPDGSGDEPMRDSSPYEPELDVLPPAQDQAVQIPEINVSAQPPPPPPPPPLFPQFPLALPGSGPILGPLPVPPPVVNAAPGAEESQNGSVRIPGLQAIPTTQPTGLSLDLGVAGAHLPGAGGNIRENINRPYYSRQNVPEQNPIRNHSPVIRAHNLSPIAPQPAHVSPLALVHQPSAVQQEQQKPQELPQTEHGYRPQEPQEQSLRQGRQHGEIRRATPPQVAALRKRGPSVGSSPDSSPQGGNRPAEKRKSKKKKRKAERQAAEAAAPSPFIKPEPRSPSPLSAPAFTRPAKRQRHEQRQQDETDYDEPRYEPLPPADVGYREHYQPRGGYREERVSAQYDPHGDPGAYHGSRQPIVISSGTDLRYDREYDDRRLPPPPPQRYSSSYPTGYGTDEVRVVHPSPRAGVGGYYPDPPNPYREIHDGPHGDRQPAIAPVDRERPRSPIVYERPVSVMPPPRQPPSRIYIDEYGREYIEPPRPPLSYARRSVAPGGRAGEPDVVYEQGASPWGLTRRPSFEEGGIVYRRASPAPAHHQRRTITQPEFVGPPDYRAYREREYSARPMGAPPAEGYAPPRAYAEDRRVASDPYREFMPRPSSVRPAADGIRYENAPSAYERRLGPEADRDQLTRAPSTRPPEAARLDAAPAFERRVVDSREYLRAASVRPAEPIRYEVAREYVPRVGSVRPEVPNREYAASVRPDLRHDAAIQPPPPPPPPPPAVPRDARTYSARPAETDAPTVRQEYRVRPAQPVYEGSVLRGDEEVIYVGPASHPGAYHPVHRSH